jgi:hypothetical protein
MRGEADDGKVAALQEEAGERHMPMQMTEVNCAEVRQVMGKDGAERWEAVAWALARAFQEA